MTRRGFSIGLTIAGVALVCAIVVGTVMVVALPPAHSNYTPRDPALRRSWLYFYVPRQPPDSAHAMVVFFGNDIGFWGAHQELAADLAARGNAVVGVNVKPLIRALPGGDAPDVAARRDSIFGAQIASVIRGARSELGMESHPVVLIGHSFGAELAVWTAKRIPIPGLRGVVAISPAARGHLMITLQDLANVGSPREPGSFSVAGTVAALPSTMRVALIRGNGDPLRRADPGIIAAGRTRLHYWLIPMAGHSLKRVMLARYMVHDAVEWVLHAPVTP